MSPLHHHFELRGEKESKITVGSGSSRGGSSGRTFRDNEVKNAGSSGFG